MVLAEMMKKQEMKAMSIARMAESMIMTTAGSMMLLSKKLKLAMAYC